MTEHRRPSLLRGYAKQLAAEIIGDEPLQADGRADVQEARADEDVARPEPLVRPARKPKGDESDGTL